MGKRVMVDADIYRYLVTTVAGLRCVCASRANRNHDGVCLMCWALAARLRELRAGLALAPGDEWLVMRIGELSAEKARRSAAREASDV